MMIEGRGIWTYLIEGHTSADLMDTNNLLSAITHTGPITVFNVAALEGENHKREHSGDGFYVESKTLRTIFYLRAGNGRMETNQRQ